MRRLPACVGLKPRALVGELLGFYYPVHYRTGMDLESVMCQGRISRKQAAILWLIHSRGVPQGWVRRKEIEARLVSWFESSNSSISKLLRGLSKPPLSLVKQAESPDSGREKVVRLTKRRSLVIPWAIRSKTRRGPLCTSS